MGVRPSTMSLSVNADNMGSPSTSQRWSVLPRIGGGLLLSLLVKFVIPYRMASVMLFVVQLVLALPHGREQVCILHPNTSLTCTQSPRSYLQVSALLVTFFMLPLLAPAIAVWGRNVWVTNKHQFSEDHALLAFLPLLLLVELSSIGRLLSSNKKYDCRYWHSLTVTGFCRQLHLRGSSLPS